MVYCSWSLLWSVIRNEYNKELSHQHFGPRSSLSCLVFWSPDHGRRGLSRTWGGGHHFMKWFHKKSLILRMNIRIPHWRFYRWIASKRPPRAWCTSSCSFCAACRQAAATLPSGAVRNLCAAAAYPVILCMPSTNQVLVVFKASNKFRTTHCVYIP